MKKREPRGNEGGNSNGLSPPVSIEGQQVAKFGTFSSDFSHTLVPLLVTVSNLRVLPLFVSGFDSPTESGRSGLEHACNSCFLEDLFAGAVDTPYFPCNSDRKFHLDIIIFNASFEVFNDLESR